MEKTLLEDEITDEEDFLNIGAGRTSPDAIQKQKEYLEDLRKKFEQKKNESQKNITVPEDVELTDDELERIKAGRTHI